MNESQDITQTDVPHGGQARLALLDALSASVGVTPRRRRHRSSAGPRLAPDARTPELGGREQRRHVRVALYRPATQEVRLPRMRLPA